MLLDGPFDFKLASLDDFQLAELCLWHDPIDPTTSSVIFFEHLIQLADMPF